MVQFNGGDEITPDDSLSDCIDPGNCYNVTMETVHPHVTLFVMYTAPARGAN